MSKPTGNDRIDSLFAGTAGSQPIVYHDADTVAVGLVQELLECHQKPGVSLAIPRRNARQFGKFGPVSKKAVLAFKNEGQKPVDFTKDPTIDTTTLRLLVGRPATTPRAVPLYLALVLDQALGDCARLACLTSLQEEQAAYGGFATCIKQQPDDSEKTGVSFGLLNWTQGSKRFGNMLDQFHANSPARFRELLGLKDEAAATALLDHAKAGADHLQDDGSPVIHNPSYPNFQERTWLRKLRTLGCERAFQKIQLATAISDLQAYFQALRTYDAAKRIHSVWGVSYWLDVADQVEPEAIRKVYTRIVTQLGSNPTEDAIIQAQYAKSEFKARREFFMNGTGLPKGRDFDPSG